MIKDDKPSSEATDILGRLIHTDADPEDIIALARLLGPLEHKPGAGPSLLRRAFEREGYKQIFSDAQLEELASTQVGGRDRAWELANQPPLAFWVHESLRRQCGIKDMAHRACVAIELAPKAALTGSPNYESGDFAAQLLERSREGDLGLDPFLALARQLGQDPVRMSIGAGEARSRALLRARSPRAFDMLLASDADPREDVGGQPLWSAMRERAVRRSDEELRQAIEAWAAKHESKHEERRSIALYFDTISNYGGDERFKKRKDWHEVVDEKGRTAMMALALGRAASIKAWWDIKKAHSGAARQDFEGRSLWHYLVAKGKEAPGGTADFLAKHVPAALDKHGRGILASLMLAPLDGRAPDHEFIFERKDLAIAAKAVPDANLWFGCEDGADAQAFAHWLANERYLHSSAKPNHSLSMSRSVQQIAKLCVELDPASFQSLPAPIAGALAFNLAIASAKHPQQSYSDDPTQEAAAKAIGKLLDAGGALELSEASSKLLDAQAAPGNAASIKAAFEAARQAQELRAHVGAADPESRKAATGRRI